MGFVVAVAARGSHRITKDLQDTINLILQAKGYKVTPIAVQRLSTAAVLPKTPPSRICGRCI